MAIVSMHSLQTMMVSHILIKNCLLHLSAMNYFRSQVVTPFLHNCESWISMAEKHIKKMENLQNIFLSRVLETQQQGTLKGMIKMDGGILLMYRVHKTHQPASELIWLN